MYKKLHGIKEEVMELQKKNPKDVAKLLSLRKDFRELHGRFSQKLNEKGMFKDQPPDSVSRLQEPSGTPIVSWKNG